MRGRWPSEEPEDREHAAWFEEKVHFIVAKLIVASEDDQHLWFVCTAYCLRVGVILLFSM